MVLLQALGVLLLIAAVVVIITVGIPLWLTRKSPCSTFPRDESKRPVNPWYVKEKS